MSYSWEETKQAVEREEDARLERLLAEGEATAGHVPSGFYPVQRARPYLELFGGLVMGVYAGMMTLVFNYLLFNWILHVNFAY